ncbi:hypothetical protein SAMN04488082_102269 [Desulfomicrobium apsheronum]|uniref:Uncharacterized protein n=1 Tax=Desulfomicrobium apsheronum TaxID=52560 RepID=A0A1I3QBW5_9BACT|nr:hypothetical protein SAMN04488082_102269 [Desulfomicrobium apsheronum]
MPPAGRGLAPCTPFTYFFLHTRSHQLKRSGVGRARVVGCLTELGIVCFPAVRRTTRCSLPKAQGREALRGPRGSSGRPCPVRAGTRIPAKAMPPAGRGLAPCTPFTYFFLHTRSHQLKRSGVGRVRAVGCLTEPSIVCFSAVPRTTRCFLPEAQGREALRGPRGSSGRPCPVRDGTRHPDTIPR